MTGQVSGEYQVTTYSSNGQRVCSSRLLYNGTDAVQTIRVQPKLAQGMYKVEILNPVGGMTAINVLVE